jgi:ATP-dependent RNA helicase DDX52/ROK1
VILKKRNCICVSPTGSGKTLAFLFPFMLNLLQDKKKGKATKALIVAPTFELSLQIYSVALQFLGKEGEGGLVVKHINKMAFGEEMEKYGEEFKTLDILVTTPLKFIKIAEKGVEISSFEYIALDEADKYFELGFIEQFKSLTDLFKTSQKHYSLFSATLPPQIEKLILEILVDPVQIIVKGKMAVLDTITQKLTYCGTEYGKILEIKNIINVESRLTVGRTHEDPVSDFHPVEGTSSATTQRDQEHRHPGGVH